MSHNFEHVLITGASSGIGAALASHLAGNSKRLTLLGRDVQRLERVAAACAADVTTIAVDVRDKESMHRTLQAAFQRAPVDLLIANAGISGGDPQTLMSVNVEGLLNSVEPLIGPMCKNGRGQIAVMSSLASFRGMPNAPAYCASKAAIRLYGEGLRGKLAAHGVSVSVICPGFIATPLTAKNPFPMPFLMSPERAATRIASGLARDQARIAFPRRLYWPLLLASLLPPAVIDSVVGRYAAKE